ncbi:alpha/beta hydrolase [[Mycobacterium] vasticus]|uniref:Alpha/beta fold hydrolase n=1 Tax=[Mycobacterium] vasticus TaxID=2875777 RepID=A0ABU5YWZ3_9MYCO|nr:alpha/beta hydrolase [Mycolicibacter sp. MYC017]MEB3069622.1 alpha/beta fold hydrolase [Mycolicibacter sp. MYC017]
MNRADVTFLSGGTRCAGWLYRPDNAARDLPCVVMAHGFGLRRHDGLPGYAEALAQAGAAVLVYDHRYLGDSEGEPRQRVRMSEQLQDRLAAIAFARTIEGIDPGGIIVWGYSLSGGTAVQAAAADQQVAGAILLCPFLDGRWRSNHGMRIQPRNAAWVTVQAMRDTLIPIAAEPGTHGGMTFPGEFAGFRSIAAPDWRNEVYAGVTRSLPFWRPVARARKLNCPALIQAGERDTSVSARAIARLAQRAPRATLKNYDVNHFQAFNATHSPQIITDQADWLRALLTARCRRS